MYINHCIFALSGRVDVYVERAQAKRKGMALLSLDRLDLRVLSLEWKRHWGLPLPMMFAWHRRKDHLRPRSAMVYPVIPMA